MPGAYVCHPSGGTKKVLVPASIPPRPGLHGVDVVQDLGSARAAFCRSYSNDRANESPSGDTFILLVRWVTVYQAIEKFNTTLPLQEYCKKRIELIYTLILEQVAQQGCGCSHPGSIQGQVGFEQPGLEGGGPGLELDGLKGPFQLKLFYDSKIFSPFSPLGISLSGIRSSGSQSSGCFPYN